MNSPVPQSTRSSSSVVHDPAYLISVSLTFDAGYNRTLKSKLVFLAGPENEIEEWLNWLGKGLARAPESRSALRYSVRQYRGSAAAQGREKETTGGLKSPMYLELLKTPKKLGRMLALFVLSAACLTGAARSETTGMPFLKMGVGAHAQAMGGAFMAQVQDGSANHWNPSAIAGMQQRDLFLYHSNLFSDLSYNYVGYAHPFKSRKAGFGVAAGYMTKGSFTARDASGRTTGDFNASDMVATFSYARMIGDRVSLGASGNYVRSQIESSSSHGFAVDAAGTYDWSDRTRMALGVYHLGQPMSYISETFKLPATAALGISQKIGSPFTLTAEGRYGLYDEKFNASVGGELSVASMASLRLGYSSQVGKNPTKIGSDPDNRINNLSGMGMGIGFALFKHAHMDYAFVPWGEMGGTHHVDLSWRY